MPTVENFPGRVIWRPCGGCDDCCQFFDANRHFYWPRHTQVWQLDKPFGGYPFPIASGDVILLEVLQGFSNNRDHATAEQLFQGLPVLGMLCTTRA